ncbi:hypothetical protein GmHk_U059632 [Glycine max]|nr:hypothetical protein GmHk_U059632 [Glycine max]
MRARARVMGEIEEVQEQMNANMEAMKELMATMMEAMMSMKKIMEVNRGAVAATSVATEVDPTHSSGLNQEALGSTGSPHFVQLQNKHAFPLYGLPPNYTAPNSITPLPYSLRAKNLNLIMHVPQPMGETHEVPHHNLADFKPRLGYATEGQAVGGVPLPNTLEGPQFRPQPQPLHFAVGRVPPAMGSGSSSRAPNDGEGDDNNDIRHVTYEKMVGYMPSSFADLVFVDERIEVGLRRSKFDYPALMNGKPGANGENEKEGGTHATMPFLHGPIPYQLNNINTRPILSRTPNHPQMPPLNQPQSSPVAQPIPNTTLYMNQNTNQGRNFPTKKPVEFTQISVSYANLLPYLLNNSMVAITPAKVPQPPFFRGYNSNATCAYHGGIPGHSIEHYMTLKHKVQSLIDSGWLKFEEDNNL